MGLGTMTFGFHTTKRLRRPVLLPHLYADAFSGNSGFCSIGFLLLHNASPPESYHIEAAAARRTENRNVWAGAPDGLFHNTENHRAEETRSVIE